MSNFYQIPGLKRTSCILFACSLSIAPLAQAATAPANVSSRLAAAIKSSQQAAFAKTSPLQPEPLVTDAQKRVLTDIYLNGKETVAQVHARILHAGGKITGEIAWYRHGVISAFVPIEKVTDLATSGAVQSIFAASRPKTHVGATTSQGVYVTGANTVHGLGINGTGITVGAISDSFNTAETFLNGQPLTIHAADDVATGDLPGKGNPFGYETSVRVIQDDTNPADRGYVYDEGRALLQVVADMAPGSHLAFATAEYGEAGFAENIIKLRTEANADVIVDDVGYFDEPYYSDGLLSQTVDYVSTAPTAVLPGKKVAYFSSAGNGAGGSYEGIFTPISAKKATALNALGNLQLSQVPPALYSGGFQNFGSTASPYVVLDFVLTPDEFALLNLYWNDPQFIDNGITTDYNILVFDANGNYIPELSSTDNNFQTQNPYEIAAVEAGSTPTSMQVVITRSGTTPLYPVANHIHISTPEGAVPVVNIFGHDDPDTYGHPTAQSAIGVAAWAYDNQISFQPVLNFFGPIQEYFSSPGPISIYFDDNGNRLPKPDVRRKPDVSAPDGVNTTFFGDDDPEGDGFPNFYGTSCAAPHAAGAAALLLQKAGGPGSLTTDDIRSALINTADTLHLKSLVMISGTSTTDAQGNRVVVTADGDFNSSNDPNFFTIKFLGQPGSYLQSISIDIAPATEKFDSTTATGYPFTLGSLTTLPASDIRAIVPPQDPSFPKVALEFTPGKFLSSDTVAFGIDRDTLATGAGGNAASYLEDATFTAKTSSGLVKGTLRLIEIDSRGYDRHVGYGLINAAGAATKVPTALPAVQKVSLR